MKPNTYKLTTPKHEYIITEIEDTELNITVHSQLVPGIRTTEYHKFGGTLQEFLNKFSNIETTLTNI